MKNLILDIDGTLWNSTGVVADGWNKALREADVPELRNLVITPERLREEFGKTMSVIADDLFGPIPPETKARLLELCCRYEHEAIVANTKDITYPGVREAMRELSEKAGLYIVSNCQDGYVELVMEKNGIADIIRDYECYGHTGLTKDRNIRLVVERNKLEDVWYVGDTDGDQDASRKAGVGFIHAAYGFGQVSGADHTIQKFSDLLSLV